MHPVLLHPYCGKEFVGILTVADKDTLPRERLNPVTAFGQANTRGEGRSSRSCGHKQTAKTACGRSTGYRQDTTSFSFRMRNPQHSPTERHRTWDFSAVAAIPSICTFPQRIRRASGLHRKRRTPASPARTVSVRLQPVLTKPVRKPRNPIAGSPSSQNRSFSAHGLSVPVSRLSSFSSVETKADRLCANASCSRHTVSKVATAQGSDAQKLIHGQSDHIPFGVIPFSTSLRRMRMLCELSFAITVPPVRFLFLVSCTMQAFLCKVRQSIFGDNTKNIRSLDPTDCPAVKVGTIAGVPPDCSPPRRSHP